MADLNSSEQPQTPPQEEKSGSKRGALILAVLILVGIAGFAVLTLRSQKQLPPSDKKTEENVLLATVSGQKIYTSDVTYMEKLIEGPLKAQKAHSSSVNADIDFKLALEQTKQKVAIEQEAKRLGIVVSNQEVEDLLATQKSANPELFSAQLAIYQWAEDDWKQNAKFLLLRTRVGDRITSWREVEIISLRWDFIDPAERKPLEELNSEAQTILEPVINAFNENKTIEEAFVIVDTASVKKTFVPQKSSNSTNQLGEVIVGVHVTGTSAMGEGLKAFILNTQFPSEADVFCNEAACYSMRFVNGSNGQYTTLDDFYKAIIQ